MGGQHLKVVIEGGERFGGDNYTNDHLNFFQKKCIFYSFIAVPGNQS